jgi:hypothetical protein
MNPFCCQFINPISDTHGKQCGEFLQRTYSGQRKYCGLHHHEAVQTFGPWFDPEYRKLCDEYNSDPIMNEILGLYLNAYRKLDDLREAQRRERNRSRQPLATWTETPEIIELTAEVERLRLQNEAEKMNARERQHPGILEDEKVMAPKFKEALINQRIAYLRSQLLASRECNLES